MNGIRTAAWAMAVLALGACSARHDDPSGTAENLLTTDDRFAEDVTVRDDRLEVPYKGHEGVLGYERGKLLVGGPASDVESVNNPRGFLRRVESVRREGDTLVLMTSSASLTDLFQGDVRLENTAVLDPVRRTGGLTPQADWSGSYPKRIDIPKKTLFDKHLTGDSTAWDVNVGVDGGYLDFVPTIESSIDLSGASLKSVKLSATGKVEADVSLTLDVTATGVSDSPSDLQTFEVPLYTAPRIRWFQMVGFVPVWESLEARLIIRCGVRPRGSVQAGLGFHAASSLTAGGEYRPDEGFKTILEGPTFDFSPRVDASVSGTVYAKCSLLPEVTLFAYDSAGPSLTVGPYLEGELTHPPAGPTPWHANAGFSADIGGRMSIFGHDVINEHKTILDKKFGSWDGVLPL